MTTQPQPLTPTQAIERVMELCNITAEQYHTTVVSMGIAHAEDLCNELLPGVPAITAAMTEELVQNIHLGFWQHWQNQVYLKNLRFIQVADMLKQLPAPVQHEYWRKKLQAQHIVARPSTDGFTRKVAVILRSIVPQQPRREVLS